MFAAATWDFLLGETDRHGENVLLDDRDVPNGGTVKVRLIDNDNALTVDEHTSISSFLVPGTKWWRILRNVRYGNRRMCCVGSLFGAANADEVAKKQTDPGEQDKADACGKLGDEELLGPEVVFDPRCHAPGRFVGTSLPPASSRGCARSRKTQPRRSWRGTPGWSALSARPCSRRAREEYLEGGYEFALLREFSRAKMMDCKEEEDAGGSPGKGLGTGLSPVQVAPERALLLASPSGNCNAVRVKDAPGGADTDSLDEEAREIFPGNPPGLEYRRLYEHPVEVSLSPRRRIHPFLALVRGGGIESSVGARHTNRNT